MSTLTINQHPGYETLPAGQEIIFVIGVGGLAETEQLKVVADIYIADSLWAFATTAQRFKANINAQNVAIFDFGEIVEQELTPTYSGFDNNLNFPLAESKFKNVTFNDTSNYHTIHQIDKYAQATNGIKYFKVHFGAEYKGANSSLPNQVARDNSLQTLVSKTYLAYNGVLYDTDKMRYVYESPLVYSNYGYDLVYNNYIMQTGSGCTGSGGFLTDAPTTQYARINDYGTLPFLQGLTTQFYGFNQPDDPDGTTNPHIEYFEIKYYNSAGAQVGATVQVDNTQANGGYSGANTDVPWAQLQSPLAQTKLIYAGLFPGNLRNWEPVFIVNLNSIDHYTIQGYSTNTNVDCKLMGQMYTIRILCEELMGYSPIRLTWLNKHGTWDYYTFMKKSVRSISTKRKPYTQLRGTWNEKNYSVNTRKGGKKNYNVNTRETIKMNSDYMSEEESVWLEQLMNSTEVFILNGWTTSTAGNINKYVEPVTVKTSSYKRKTRGNDKLIQYTFEVERANIRRTQRV